MWRVVISSVCVLAVGEKCWGLTVESIYRQPEVPWLWVLPIALGAVVLAVAFFGLWRSWRQAINTNEDFKSLIHRLPYSLIEVDNCGHVQRTIHCARDSIIDESWLGRTIFDLLQEEGRETLKQYLERAVNASAPQCFRIAVSWYGKAMHFLVHLESAKGSASVLAILTDITHFIEAEQALVVARANTERQLHIREAHWVNMSHEIRVPLNAIVSTASLMDGTYLSDEMNQYKQSLLNHTEHLRRLVDEALSLTTTKEGELSLEETDLHLWDILDDLERMFAQQAGQQQVDFMIDQHLDVPRYVRLDGFRLRQILYNLIDNALQFTDQGSVRLEISTNDLAQKAYLRFSVIDTGCGFDATHIHRIFAASEQGVAKTAKECDNPGLGLSMCKKLVALMGGVIGVQSELGAGSTFWFTVPLNPLPEPESWSYWRDRGVELCLESEPHRRWFEQFFGVLRIPIKNADVGLLVCDYDADSVAPCVWWTATGEYQGTSPVVTLVMPWQRTVLIERLLDDSVANQKELLGEASPSTCAGRALLIESDSTNAVVIRRMLENLGMEVHYAVNGQEGVEAFEQQLFDVVLMGLHMPVMDGIEVSKRIRQRPFTKYTPIVVLAENRQQHAEEACFMVGVDAFLTQPIDLAQLKNTLKTVLGGHKVTQPAD